MIDPKFGNINRLFILSFKNGDDDLSGNSFDEYYTPLVAIKNFNALIDKNRKTNKNITKNLLKCQEKMIIQQETYQITHIIKVVINSLVQISQDNKYNDYTINQFYSKIKRR